MSFGIKKSRRYTLVGTLFVKLFPRKNRYIRLFIIFCTAVFVFYFSEYVLDQYGSNVEVMHKNKFKIFRDSFNIKSDILPQLQQVKAELDIDRKLVEQVEEQKWPYRVLPILNEGRISTSSTLMKKKRASYRNTNHT